MAYSEVLEILKYLPEEERRKIPEKEIAYLKENCDPAYEFSFHAEKPLKDQGISRKASAIMVMYFKKYFAEEKQKQKLDEILLKNQQIKEEAARKTYNPDEIFSSRSRNREQTVEKVEIVPYKRPIFTVIFEKIKNFFRK